MKLTFVCLRLTRHSDSRSVLTAFSRELGRVALSVPAGGGKGAARTRAITMPLSIVQCETSAAPGREVMPMRQPAPAAVFGRLHSHPVKQMTAMFVADLIAAVMRHGGADETVFDYLCASAAALDAASETELPNYLLCFMTGLAGALGIEPDISTWRPGRILDLREGLWRQTAPLHSDALDPASSDAAARLARMTFANMGRYRMTQAERRLALDQMIRYMAIHLGGIGAMRTLGVLRSLV